MTRAGDDAERSDEEERRFERCAGDDAERSDEEERRFERDDGAAGSGADD